MNDLLSVVSDTGPSLLQSDRITFLHSHCKSLEEHAIALSQ
ncbi:hypothetical protein [Aetokthonos hydrillicola]|jgi:hypothetical protein|nr:hypothetical protein [Aetokthonos hydrillicola]